MSDLGGHSLIRRGNRLVQIHAWCLMRNHFHLLLSECIEGGISKFLMKVNVGYAKYFNEKYKRNGTLFQGRSKKILIERESHFMHILNYIHLNPLDYRSGARDWRERRLDNASNALTYLDTYRWSSYRDYCGFKNFPSILTTSVFGDTYYREKLHKYLKHIETDSFIEVALE